jgi:hypothetical protein
VARVVTLYRKAEGRLPKNLAEVFEHRLPTGRSTDPTTDLFAHPLVYEPAEDGRSFRILSLGRDGKRGGRHADADVEVRRP